MTGSDMGCPRCGGLHMGACNPADFNVAEQLAALRAEVSRLTTERDEALRDLRNMRGERDMWMNSAEGHALQCERAATAEASAAALQGALEAVDAWWADNWDCSASPGHDGYPYAEIRAALAASPTLAANVLRCAEAFRKQCDLPGEVYRRSGFGDDAIIRGLLSNLCAAVDEMRGKGERNV